MDVLKPVAFSKVTVFSMRQIFLYKIGLFSGLLQE
jgi:hypothetical protein